MTTLLRDYPVPDTVATASVSWQVTDDEWLRLGHLLAAENGSPGPQGGRPRLDNDRLAAQACLYRHYHELAPAYHCFGWNAIPAALGISPSTANRRFREWTAAGQWARFWDALMRLRRGGEADPYRHEPRRLWGSFPAGDVVAELERAYAFFNDRFFAGVLEGAAITVERFVGKRRRQPGDFCPRQWRLGERTVGHIALSAEVLGRGAAAALTVLLHEMVHLRNDQVGMIDCTPPYQYHNRHFRDAALLAGLECPHRDPKHGYWVTVAGPRGLQALAELQPREEFFGWKVETGQGWG
jgi:transposase